MSKFDFLRISWASIYESASKAEMYIESDPEASCINARKALEGMVKWIYKNEDNLRLGSLVTFKNEDNLKLGLLIACKDFQNFIGQENVGKAEIIKDRGNKASHHSSSFNWKKINSSDARYVVGLLYSLAFWFAKQYSYYQILDHGNSFENNIYLNNEIAEDNQITVNTSSFSKRPNSIRIERPFPQKMSHSNELATKPLRASVPPSILLPNTIGKSNLSEQAQLPVSALYYGFRGDSKAKSGDYEGAIAAYTEAIQIVDSNEFENYYYYGGRGDAKAKLGDYEGAI
jgi:tetratricopeptide (TPR) repeat protein